MTNRQQDRQNDRDVSLGTRCHSRNDNFTLLTFCIGGLVSLKKTASCEYTSSIQLHGTHWFRFRLTDDPLFINYRGRSPAINSVAWYAESLATSRGPNETAMEAHQNVNLHDNHPAIFRVSLAEC